MIDAVKSLWKDEDGPTMVEYALAVALIAVVAIGAFLLVGQATNNKMDDVSTQISTAR
jgi:pilus assembly protein Flp/PilA